MLAELHIMALVGYIHYGKIIDSLTIFLLQAEMEHTQITITDTIFFSSVFTFLIYTQIQSPFPRPGHHSSPSRFALHSPEFLACLNMVSELLQTTLRLSLPTFFLLSLIFSLLWLRFEDRF